MAEVDDLDFTRRAVSNNMLFAIVIDSLFYALSTHFEPLYTNIYLIGPSDGAVSWYTFRLEIYGATSVRIFVTTDVTSPK